MEFMQAISDRIRELMREGKLTQKQLAFKAKISISTLNKILKVKQKDINPRTLILIANGLNKSMKEFFNTETFDKLSKQKDD